MNVLVLAQSIPTLTAGSGAESTIVAAAVVTVIAAVVGGLVSVINAIAAAFDRRAAMAERKVLSASQIATEKKADVLLEKTTEIHTLTNSNLSKVTAALEVANQKIEGLQRLIGSMIDSAALAAAATNAAAAAATSSAAAVAAATAAAGPRVRATDKPGAAVPVVVVNDPLVTATAKE